MRFAVHYRPGSPFSGGGYTYIDTIIRELAERVGATKHSMVLFVIGGKVPKEYIRKSVDIHRISAISLTAIAFVVAGALRRWQWHPFLGLQRLIDYILQARLAASLRSRGVEFLWSPQPFVHTMEIPFAVTVWDLQHRKQGFFPEVSASGQWRAREQSYAEVIRRAVYVIASNETGKREVEQFYQMPPERVISLPHFTPRWVLNLPKATAGQLPERFGLSPGNYVLYPAQFWPHKNHVRIIEALAMLRKDNGLSLKAVLVGVDHGNLTYVKSVIAQHGLGDLVHFPGFVSNAELAWLYRNAHSLVYASMFGPENLPPLEAFALGCPVICARYDGATDQLGEAALYFSPYNAVELADCLRKLNASGLRDRLLKAGAEIARARTPQKYVEGIFRLLDEFQTVRRCWH
jgi:glycosyltransferase involved in cell wall biosynthesis